MSTGEQAETTLQCDFQEFMGSFLCFSSRIPRFLFGQWTEFCRLPLLLAEWRLGRFATSRVLPPERLGCVPCTISSLPQVVADFLSLLAQPMADVNTA